MSARCLALLFCLPLFATTVRGQEEAPTYPVNDLIRFDDEREGARWRVVPIPYRPPDGAAPFQAPALREPVLLPGIGHWTQQEAPEAVTTAMLEFLASLGRP